MRKSKLSQTKLLEHFIAGTTARCAMGLLGVNRKTAVYYFQRLKEIIMLELEKESRVDESYFGGKGRGVAGKIPVFGILKRGGKVYTQMIPDASSQSLLPIIKRKVIPDSVVYSDNCLGYNTLDVSGFKHYRINHSETFIEKQNHINGIENFWSQAKRHLRRFNGVPKELFHLFLKECEWRFNNPYPHAQLNQLK